MAQVRPRMNMTAEAPRTYEVLQLSPSGTRRTQIRRETYDSILYLERLDWCPHATETTDLADHLDNRVDFRHVHISSAEQRLAFIAVQVLEIVSTSRHTTLLDGVFKGCDEGR